MNASYTTTAGVTLRTLLDAWLQEKLAPKLSPELHEFAERTFGDKPIAVLGGRLQVNPLWFSNSSPITEDFSRKMFTGFLHGDLHPGNLLVDRYGTGLDRYWLIDLAHAKTAPIFYDHSYFELALIIRHLGGAEPERLFGILDYVQANAGSSALLPLGDVGLSACIIALRAAISDWQSAFEPKRWDSVMIQLGLSRVAAGINWANKPLVGSARVLALAFASYNAELLLRLLAPDVLQ